MRRECDGRRQDALCVVRDPLVSAEEACLVQLLCMEPLWKCS